MSIRHADCGPSGPQPYIRSAQADNSKSTEELLSELFDNAIDAGATTIDAKMEGIGRSGRGTFTISDNGRGVDRIEALMRLADSSKDGDGTIGRWGVGAKDCIYTVGGLTSTLLIESRSVATCWRSTITWSSQRTWALPQEDCTPDDLSLSTKTGTRISIQRCSRQLRSTNELRAHIAKSHWPWLAKQGNRITINGEPVTPPKAPATDGRFDPQQIMRIDDDRWFTVEGGVLQDSDALNGVTVWAGNRAIYTASAMGTGDYSSGGIFVLVRLHGRWDLERNKKGLSEVHAEELRASLFEILAPTLQDASERMRELDDGDFLDRINDAFGSVQGHVGKPRRPGKPGEKRERERRGGDRKVNEAAVIRGEGEARERASARRRSPYMIQFIHGEEGSIGSVDSDSRRISLHKNNPSVAVVKARKDDEAVLFFAAALLADSDNGGKLPFPGRFAELVATILKVGSQEVA